MRDELFNELVESVKEGGAILRGERPAAAGAGLETPDVAAIRQEYGLSQAKFAALPGISVLISPGVAVPFAERSQVIGIGC